MLLPLTIKSIRIIILSVLFGILGWIIDTVVDVTVFDKGDFYDLLVFIPSYEIYVRSVFFVLIVALGFVGAFMYAALEKKRAEISHEKKEWERTFHSVPDLVAVIGNDFRIKKVNRALSERLGVDPHEIEETFCYSIFHETKAPPSFCPHFQMIKDPKGSSIEIYSGKMNGHFLVSVDPLYDENGQIMGSVHIARDITERKQAEDTLRESQRFIQKIADTTPDILYIFDLARNKIVFANQRLSEVLGYSVEEINNMDEHRLAALVHSGDIPVLLELKEKIERAVDNEIIETELRIRHRDGSLRWIRCSNIVYDRDNDGKLLQIQGAGINITARKLTEEALRASEERFRMLFNKVNDAVLVYRISPSGDPMNFIEVNNVACERYGYSREELMKMSIVDLNTAINMEMIRKGVADLLTKGMVIVESVHISKDGKGIPVEINAHLFEYQGKPTVLSIARDITERKSTAEALIIKDKAIDSSINAMAISDLGGYLTYINPAFLRMWGFENEAEVIGRHVSQFWSDDEAIEGVIQELTEKNSWVGTLKGKKKDGSGMYVELVSNIVRDDKGQALCMMGAFLDITSRKENEERLKLYREDLEKLVSLRTDELRASEEDFRTLSQQFDVLLDVIPDALIVFSEDLRVNWANRSAQQSLSALDGKLTGRKCCDIWYEGKINCEECFVKMSFESGKVQGGQIMSSDGRIWDMSAYPIANENGIVQNVMLVSSDISEKVELQAERMRAAHLASIGELAAGVAHEINNPVNGIINYAQILANKVADDSNEFDIVSRIIKEGDRITSIVHSLLSFARDRKEKRSMVNMKELIIETMILTEANIKKQGISLRIDIPDGLPLLHADPQQLMQVFLNIINNARYSLMQKKSQVGKELAISVTVEERESGDIMKIAFFDNGMGIAPENMGKIMNPFFTTKPVGIGTGLGLSVSHGIISDHNGRILVDSIEGEYAKITIELPLNEVRT